MITLEKLRLVKEMITLLLAYQIIITLLITKKIIAMDLSKQQAFDADPIVIR